MEKTVVSKDYRVLLDLLKGMRERGGITQIEMASRLGMTQSMVSKCERGERRLDLIELRQWCVTGLEVPLLEVVGAFEALLAKPPRRKARKG